VKKGKTQVPGDNYLFCVVRVYPRRISERAPSRPLTQAVLTGRATCPCRVRLCVGGRKNPVAAPTTEVSRSGCRPSSRRRGA